MSPIYVYIVYVLSKSHNDSTPVEGQVGGGGCSCSIKKLCESALGLTPVIAPENSMLTKRKRIDSQKGCICDVLNQNDNTNGTSPTSCLIHPLL